MDKYEIELGLYQDCFYEIKKRTEVIGDHINRKTTEKYLIIEVETVCLQFRKILEKIMLIKDFMTMNRMLRRSMKDRGEELTALTVDRDYRQIDILAIYR